MANIHVILLKDAIIVVIIIISTVTTNVAVVQLPFYDGNGPVQYYRGCIFISTCGMYILKMSGASRGRCGCPFEMIGVNV